MKRDKFTPRHLIHHWVMRKNVDDLSLLLDQCKFSSEINETAGPFENTPLHLAATKGNSDVVDMLICRGANVNQKNKKGNTALHIATYYGHYKLLELLLARGSNINEPNKARMTCLHIAVQCSSELVIERLLESCADVRTQNIFGDTPLHDALKRNCTDVVKQLLIKGAPVDFANNRGETALHIACSHCDKEVVKLLLDANANCNALTADGSTPVHYAVNNFRNSADLVPLLVQAGAATVVTNRAGETPLLIAMKQEWYSYEFLGYLLGMGLKLDQPADQLYLDIFNGIAEDAMTSPALAAVFAVAIRYKDKSLFQLLLRKGIPIDDRNQFDTTPLLEAVMSDNVHAAKVLLHLGANPNYKNSQNKSALRLANSVAMVELLLVYNADAEEANLLHRMVKRRCPSIFNLLIEKGTDVNKKCSKGFSVLHYAMGTENEQTLVNVLHAGIEPKEFFRIFYKNYQKLKPKLLFFMCQQMAIFQSQGIGNTVFLRRIKCDRPKLYEGLTKDLREMKATRICKHSSVSYYDVLMKRGDALAHILKMKKVRKAVLKLIKENKFRAFDIRLKINIHSGLRRLRLKTELQDELGAFIPFDIACHMSRYFSNTDLLKFAIGLREPSEDLF